MSLGLRHRAGADPPPSPAGEEEPKGQTEIWRRGFGLGAAGTTSRRRTAAVSIVAALAIGLAFELVVGQAPLYTGNQHTYLLHGLAQADVGLLASDWLAGTTDPTPVASLLVALIAKLGAEWLILVLHALLIGAYGLALLGIGATLFGIRSTAGRLVLLAGLLFVHSWLAVRVGGGLPGNLRALTTEGLAGQYAAGLTFQPSLFGVLLIVSLLLYARGRPLAAVACAGAAAIFHPTYLLAALILCAAYLADTFFRTGARATVARGAALAAVLLVPVAVYALVAFAPGPQAIHEAAQGVLVDFRISRHAKPEKWFGADDAFRLGLVAVGLALAWRSVLFPVLALATAAGAILTALQLVTGSDTLALLFPWRLSIFLVPVSAALVLAAATRGLFALGRGVARLASRLGLDPERLTRVGHRVVGGLAGLVIAVSIVAGGDRIGRLEAEPRQSAIGQALAARRAPGDLYLVPPQRYELRLDGGVPIYVDYKSHPYRDDQVVAWRSRLLDTTRIYYRGSLRCDRLAPVARRERITHVVVQAPMRARCDFLRRSFAADDFTVFEVEAKRPGRA
jgi:hypothetical protein